MKFTKELKSKFKILKSKYGIFDRQWREECLQLIIDNEGITITEIYCKLRIEQSVASQAVKELRQKGLVRFVRNKTNGKKLNYFPNTNKIKKYFFGEELEKGRTLAILQTQAIMNFWLAEHNMTKYNLVENVFPASRVKHMQGILEDCEFNLFKFIEKIDEKNRGKLIAHIMREYDGISAANVEKRYFQK